MAADKQYTSIYDSVIRYQIKAVCREPFHVGSGDSSGEILIHPVLMRPFLPATGIAGAFREYFSYDQKLQRQLFGFARTDEMHSPSDQKLQRQLSGHALQGSETVDNEDNGVVSRLKFSDGEFDIASVCTEMRPHVHIDAASGSVKNVKMLSDDLTSGQKFETELVSRGSEFYFQIYLFDKAGAFLPGIDAAHEVERALAALTAGDIRFGGQKSNGCGHVSLKSVKKTTYNMTCSEDRRSWRDESKDAKEVINDILKIAYTDHRLHLKLSAKTKGAILVKAINVASLDSDAPDAVNITDHAHRYILPASSVKGVVRGQIEKIVDYMKLDTKLVTDIFGLKAKKGQNGHVGCAQFYDCEIGCARANDAVLVQRRIHIDKFTGGVMNGEFFSEKPAYGALCIRIDVDNYSMENKETYRKVVALLLFALRDMGLGILPVGSGSSIGRGYLEGCELTVRQRNEILVRVDFRTGKVTKGTDKLLEYLQSL